MKISENSNSLAEAIEAYKKGLFLVHATDTLPGLSVNPFVDNGCQRLNRLKKRPISQSILGLAASPSVAFMHWKVLPDVWKEWLSVHWPEHSSFLYTANPKSLGALALAGDQQEVGIRVPGKQSLWLQSFLTSISPELMPSTSVNFSGSSEVRSVRDLENCMREFALASRESDLFGGFEIHTCPLQWELMAGVSSNIIRINKDSTYTWVRRGSHYEDVKRQLDFSQRFTEAT